MSTTRVESNPAPVRNATRRMRERRAEKLRREYERVGREQDGIFESLADYTHEVQAEVHALEAARDLLLAAGGTAVAVADEDDDHASDSAGGDVCRQEALGAETFSGRQICFAHDRHAATAAAAKAPLVVRIGRPFILGDLWVSWELATLGVLVCALLGAVVGVSITHGSNRHHDSKETASISTTTSTNSAGNIGANATSGSSSTSAGRRSRNNSTRRRRINGTGNSVSLAKSW